ncbi:MAG: hypothetical protein JNG88_10365, partial [Phycisphaerales bacterium]|nr:hypothetical protein [Phycisphaerales bacterium]
MSTQVSFWKRLSSVFRADMPTTRGGEGPLLNAGPATSVEDRSLLRWLRGDGRSSRRERASAMMHLLEQHLQQQDQRAAQLSASVDRVAGMLEQIASAQRSQTDVLRTIADQVERSSGHVAAAAQSISQIPASMKSQADALHIVIDEMQQNRAQGGELVQSLRRVGDVVLVASGGLDPRGDVLRVERWERELEVREVALHV